MQAMSRRAPIGDLWNSIQSWLFPVLEDAQRSDRRHPAPSGIAPFMRMGDTRIAHGPAADASKNPVLNAGKGGVCPKITISNHQTV